MNKYQIEVNNREILAKNPNTKMEILEELAFDTEPKVKKAVALRSDLPIDLIEKMAADRQIIAKKFLLRNKSFSENLLIKLAQSSEPKVLQMVALHPNTPISLLEKLATVPSAKSFVAQNSNVTIEILEQLAEGEDKKVQLAVVKNHKASSIILTKIGLNSYDAEILIPLLENKNTPYNIKETILEKISAFSSFSVLEYVAKNPYTSHDILISWSYSKYYSSLHSKIFQNPNTPENIAKKLAKKHKFTKVIKYLPNAPNTPENILIRLSKYETYAQSLLKNPNLPLAALENILKRKSTSIYICDRKFVARHPKTPTEILEKLTHDGDTGVRDAAKYRLERRTKNKEV